MSVKIGCDPEFFLFDKENNKHVSAYGMIPGNKAEPHRVDGGAVQVDGMALEFNIDPANSFEEFNNNITNVLRQLREMVPERYEFSFIPVADFGKDYIEAQPAEAKELGCDPDFNAYTKAINPKPDGNLGIRTASGHIHLGWTEGMDVSHPDHVEACQMITRVLDFYTGLTARLWDFDTRRQSMYGKWGTYRPKHYGVEYRTLSNSWVESEYYRKIVYETSVHSFNKLIEKGSGFIERWGMPAKYDSTFTTQRRLLELVSDIMGSPHISQMLSYQFNTTKKRPNAVEFRSLTQSGEFFFHHTTYELVPYKEADRQSVYDGVLRHDCANAYYSKMADLPKVSDTATTDYPEGIFDRPLGKRWTTNTKYAGITI
jgi:hypothetical protein